jgi:hypothetical protein
MASTMRVMHVGDDRIAHPVALPVALPRRAVCGLVDCYLNRIHRQLELRHPQRRRSRQQRRHRRASAVARSGELHGTAQVLPL